MNPNSTCPFSEGPVGYLSVPVILPEARTESGMVTDNQNEAVFYTNQKDEKQFFVCVKGKGYYHLRIPELTFKGRHSSSTLKGGNNWEPFIKTTDYNYTFPGAFNIVIRDSEGNKVNSYTSESKSDFSIVINGKKILFCRTNGIESNFDDELGDYSSICDNEDIMESCEMVNFVTTTSSPLDEYKTITENDKNRVFKPSSKWGLTSSSRLMIGSTYHITYLKNPAGIEDGLVYCVSGHNCKGPINVFYGGCSDIYVNSGISCISFDDNYHSNSEYGYTLTAAYPTAKARTNIFPLTLAENVKKYYFPITVLSPVLPTFGDIIAKLEAHNY